MARNDEFYDDDQGGFFKRHPAAVFAGIVVLGAIGLLAYRMACPQQTQYMSMPKEPVIVAVTPPKPPAPLQPTPPPPEPQQTKMIEQLQDYEPPVTVAPPPAGPPVSTAITGPGPGIIDFDTGRSGPAGPGTIPGSVNGSKWGFYASKVRTRIADALRKNPHTRDASIRIEVRIWPDNSGRVTRAQLVDSTGNQAVDNAIKNEVLTGLVLDAPPADMPKPILLRLTASRN